MSERIRGLAGNVTWETEKLLSAAVEEQPADGGKDELMHLSTLGKDGVHLKARMYTHMLKAKIHRATVTQVELDGTELVSELHFLEDLYGEWKDSEAHIQPLLDFFHGQLMPVSGG